MPIKESIKKVKTSLQIKNLLHFSIFKRYLLTIGEITGFPSRSSKGVNPAALP